MKPDRFADPQHAGVGEANSWGLARNELVHIRGFRVVASPPKGLVVCRAEYFCEICFVGVDPCHWGKTSDCAVDAVIFVLLECDGDHAGQEALHEVENIVDGVAYFSDRVEDVAVENHFPLDSPVRRKERAGVDREAESKFGPCR